MSSFSDKFNEFKDKAEALADEAGDKLKEGWDSAKEAADGAWDKAKAYWQTLKTDEGAHFDRIVTLDAASLPPIVSWGTSPEDVVSIGGVVPNPDDIAVWGSVVLRLCRIGARSCSRCRRRRTQAGGRSMPAGPRPIPSRTTSGRRLSIENPHRS